MAFVAFNLTEESRATLLEAFPPKFEKVIAHHVTHAFGVGADAEVPKEPLVVVSGYAVNSSGLECLLVEVNGSSVRPDGKAYHVTLSLDPDEFKPVDSNKLLTEGKITPVAPFAISVVPAINA